MNSVMAAGPAHAPPQSKHSLLLICHSYPPVLGGTEIEAQRVCTALSKAGHAVTVLCAGGPPMPPVARWTDPSGIPVRIMGHKGSQRRRDLVYALGVIWTLLTERNRFEIAYFLMPGLHLAFAVPVARLLRKKIVMKFTGSNEVRKLGKSLLGRVTLSLLRRWADRVLVLNTGMMDEAREAGFHASRVMWMPNPVDTEDFRPSNGPARLELRRHLNLADSARAVVFVGRLAPEKQLPSLLGAFARLAPRYPDAVLVLVGDGPQRSPLTAMASDYGIAHQVRFTGAVDTTTVRRWMQACDVFALVSSLEGFPCSLVEAMATGLPAVVSDIPANRQLITDDVHGYSVPVGDEQALAGVLERLLTDSSARSRLGSAGRAEVVQKYSTGKIVDRYEALFDDVLNAGTLAEPSGSLV